MRCAKGRFRSLVCMMLLVIVAGFAQAKSNDEISALLQRYVELTMARDAQGLADMFTDPAEWDGPTGAMNLSRAEMRGMFDSMFAVVTAVYAMEATNVRAAVSGDGATVKFDWMQDVENAFLGRARTEGSMTWRLQRIDGKWLIAGASTEINM